MFLSKSLRFSILFTTLAQTFVHNEYYNEIQKTLSCYCNFDGQHMLLRADEIKRTQKNRC